MEKKNYDQNHKLVSLRLVTIICNRNQFNFYKNLLDEFDAPFLLGTHGRGSASLFSQLISEEASGKSILFSVIKQNKWSSLKKRIQERFAVSSQAKGIAFTTPINSVAGVSIYKYLINDRKLEKPESKVTKIRKKIKSKITKKGGNKNGK